MTEIMRQGTNSMLVIGTLKDLEVNEGVKDGVKSISLVATVTSKVKDKVHENKISFYAKESSKLYKGYKTMQEEYKAGKDRIQITCSVERNRFKSNGEIITARRIRGIFASRVEDDSIQDQVGGILECVPISIMDEMVDNQMTGRKIVKVYSVGYNNKVDEFDLVLEQQLAAQFSQFYPIGCTAEMIVELNRYVKIDEAEKKRREAAQAQTFFGSQLDTMPDGIVDRWTNEMVIIGGRQPKVAPDAYTNEEIQEMKRLDEISLQELKSQSATPPKGNQTAFGSDPFNGATMQNHTPEENSDFPF